MTKIKVNGVTLHVRDSGGDGTPVLMLHGWPDTGDVWRHQVDALSAAGYRVVTPDLRGFGESDKPAEVDAYGRAQMVGDVLGLIDALDLGRVHLVGHDWGSAIAWMVALNAPQKLRSLTAMSTGHPVAFRRAGIAQKEKSWYILLFQFTGIAEEWIRQNDFENLRTVTRHPEIDEVIGRFTDPAALTGSLNLYRAMTPPESNIAPVPTLPPIDLPTLGMWSTHDIALVEAGMTGSAAHVRGPWRYERVEGAGHWLQLDAPDRVNAALLDFLRGLTG
ncbi:alpha/beta fold hydrolase [Catenuloplanes japonicus]|uniref:alpha/beta fold hydrolase n=1 Tax=Catenuloplanes japonicus TaxID=33876 RepID=UPI000526427A|nr:alpha/beta hydrolase [Catenuloplanes japonicus]